ncbi:MAG: eukaryotic-like serine/threonine-protein kinase [Solirubrobacterales bacterium]|nr:eukaryotic-like serine/threonine-protein kinase [Solirubrobacterales bacterium]
MSTVYLARDETLERWVAAKVLHREISDQPDQIERFRREARAVAQVSHPNVVAVIDAGEDAGRPYIVFEYCDGETLKQRIDRQGGLPLDEAAAYGIEVGRGLAAAHARRLVHRDVKPQNVLIDSEGRAKVTDFGIARELEQDGLTKTGRVLGTTDYVSPEQAMGQPVDARSDIYSLGILLYEMLIGEVPFQADNLVGVAMKHVNEKVPDVQKKRRDVSSALAAVVERATEKKPDKRYQDMNAMLADLEHALEVEVARAGHATGEATTVLDSVPRRQRLVTSRRVSIAGILLVLAATAAALVIAGLSGNDKQHQTGGGGTPAPTGSEVELTGAQDFDPPPGDGDEHGDEVKLAIDGIPNTTWQTETYSGGPDLSASTDKTGVGLIVQTDSPVEAQTITVGTTQGGWDAEIYAAADGPPTDLAGWGDPIGSVSGADAQQQIELTSAGPGQYYLIWFTKLAAADDGGRVEVSDVTLSGA